MKVSSLTTIVLTLTPACYNAYVVPQSKMAALTFRPAASTAVQMTADDAPDPTTFRAAEVLGLRLMQESNFEEALVGTSQNFYCCGP
jgi:hypothetical protein